MTSHAFAFAMLALITALGIGAFVAAWWSAWRDAREDEARVAEAIERAMRQVWNEAREKAGHYAEGVAEIDLDGGRVAPRKRRYHPKSSADSSMVSRDAQKSDDTRTKKR